MSRVVPLPLWSVRSRILAVILVITTLGMIVAGVSAYFVQRDAVIAGIDDELLGAVAAARTVVLEGPAATATSTEEPPADAAADPAAPAEPAAAPSWTSAREALGAVVGRIIPGRHESTIGVVDGSTAWLPSVDVLFALQEEAGFVDRVWEETRGGEVILGTALTPEIEGVGAIRYIAAPLTVEGGTDEGVFVTAVDVQREVDEVGGAFITFAWIAAITVVVIAGVGWFLAGRLLAPLRRLREAAEQITGSDVSQRIPVTGKDDLAALTETVNDMLARLDGTLTAQRQLLDDVRHELKTPITIVRGHLELLDPRRPTEVRAARDIAIEELDRMSELVTDIDALAQAERGRVLTEPVDVADLTQSVFVKAQAIPGHEWRLERSVAAVAPLSPSRITQAWLQLADNAAKYSAEGSTIRIGSSAYQGAIELWVADEGPGIPAEAQSRIFERFGRIDTGRGVQGSGLGLPIVAAIARAHDGYVSLSSSSAGSRFGIVIPVPSDAPLPPPAADLPASTGALLTTPPARRAGTEED